MTEGDQGPDVVTNQGSCGCPCHQEGSGAWHPGPCCGPCPTCQEWISLEDDAHQCDSTTDEAQDGALDFIASLIGPLAAVLLIVAALIVGALFLSGVSRFLTF